MKYLGKHMMALCILAVSVLSSCSDKEDGIIPRSKMAKIYAEMLVKEQWIMVDKDLRALADTTLVHEPILRKYGYTSEDYRRTVYKYLDDPERFARVFRETADILDERLSELERMKKEMEELKVWEESMIDFNISEKFPYMNDEPYVHYYDSLAVQVDSVTKEFRFVNVELSDTTYNGLEMVVRTDTSAVSDSSSVTPEKLSVDTVKLSTSAPDAARKLMKHIPEDKEKQMKQIKKPVFDKEMKVAADVKLLEDVKEKKYER